MHDGNSEFALDVRGLTKVYRSYASPTHRLKELLSSGRHQYHREVRALDNVTFSLPKGGRLGIIGENGSGKSTLLKMIAGVLTPTSGKALVDGRVSALLELGAGFNPELPGRENITQFCMLHGMGRDEIEDAVPQIIRFSELNDAIDHPVKTYSSGMAVRLGFACAVYVNPDILIVDEALSVGDAYFQNKCLHKIRAMLDQGTSFIYVTHAADSIRTLCSEALWLENGRVRMADVSSRVGAAYQSEVFNRMVRAGFEPPAIEALSETEMPVADAGSAQAGRVRVDEAKSRAFAERVASLRTGSGEIRIDDISVVDNEGADCDRLEFGTTSRVRVFFRVMAPPPEKCVLNVGITDNSGRQVLHFNPMFQGLFASDAPLHVPQMMEFRFENPLCPGEYGVEAGIATLLNHPKNNSQTLIDCVIDYCPGGARFSVLFPEGEVDRDLWGLVHVPYNVSTESLG